MYITQRFTNCLKETSSYTKSNGEATFTPPLIERNLHIKRINNVISVNKEFDDFYKIKQPCSLKT